MKATEQYFPVALFIMLYKVVLTFDSVDEILKCDYSIKMKATEQYFPVVLFIMLYKVIVTFESADEILSLTIQMTSMLQSVCFSSLFFHLTQRMNARVKAKQTSFPSLSL